MRCIQIVSVAIMALLVIIFSGKKEAESAPYMQTAPKELSEKMEETKKMAVLRSDLEKKLHTLEAAYLSLPGDNANRRGYADILFKLGNIWQANDVIAPLVTTQTSNADDLTLGAWLAYLTGAYDRAETLFGRLREVTEKGSKQNSDAIGGLLLTYYQQNQYDKSKKIGPPTGDEKSVPLYEFMKGFSGSPYQIEWMSTEKVAHIPLINDFNSPAVIPVLRIEVNGHVLECILDTGGDRLRIDEDVAKNLGLRFTAKTQARYAYTKGEMVEEQLGVAEMVKMDKATLRNVPVVVAKWRSMGPKSYGVVGTQLLKQFLSTVDYDRKEITLRERSATGKKQFLAGLGDGEPVRIPFWMSGTHTMFAKGSINGRALNLLVDSGLAANMPMVIVNETVNDLHLAKGKVAIEGTKYYWVPVQSYGLGRLLCGSSKALGNVLVDENSYWSAGFIFDALISHQYLRQFGSWTIDFDTMSYYFPPDSPVRATKPSGEKEVKETAGSKKIEVANTGDYVGSYEVAPGVALDITATDGVVFIQAPGQQKVGMEAAGGDTFVIQLAGAKIEFNRDSNGAVTTLILEQNGHVTRAEKRK